MDYTPEGFGKSTINASWKYLDEILVPIIARCNFFCTRNRFKDWNNELSTLYITIAAYMDAKEKKEQLGHITELNKAFADSKDMHNIKIALGNYDIFLRTVCKHHDFLMTQRDDVNVAFGKGQY